MNPLRLQEEPTTLSPEDSQAIKTFAVILSGERSKPDPTPLSDIAPLVFRETVVCDASHAFLSALFLDDSLINTLSWLLSARSLAMDSRRPPVSTRCFRRLVHAQY